MELNEFKLQKDWFNLETCIKEIVTIFEIQSKLKNIELSYFIDQNVPTLIYTDQQRLKQIFFNLLGNALKFTFKGSIRIKICLLPLNLLQFKVKDTGIGIAEEDQAKLFKLFGKLELKNGIN